MGTKSVHQNVPGAASRLYLSFAIKKMENFYNLFFVNLVWNLVLFLHFLTLCTYFGYFLWSWMDSASKIDIWKIICNSEHFLLWNYEKRFLSGLKIYKTGRSKISISPYLFIQKSSNLNWIIFLINIITYINIMNIKDTWFENHKKFIELMWNYPGV